MMHRFLIAGILAASVLLGGAQSPGADVVQLGHGVNLGNFLEAPTEGAWSGGRVLRESDFSVIHDAGFTLIRVPISWAAHVGPAPDYTVEPAFLARIDWVLAQAQKNGLQAILDYHNDDKLMKDPAANADRFVATWKQIAAHYGDSPPSILFELLNEPNGKLDDAHWNALLARTLPVVRASNPTRTIVVGPAWWNGIHALQKLVLPASDSHLIVTFHFYDPMKFTHQGASWVEGSDAWLGNTWQGTPDENKAMTDAFDKAKSWGDAHHRPMYLGEFGAFSKGDIASRAGWTAAVVQAANSRGFAWTYWEYCAGFGVYDPVAKVWRQPLLDSLISK